MHDVRRECPLGAAFVSMDGMPLYTFIVQVKHNGCFTTFIKENNITSKINRDQLSEESDLLEVCQMLLMYSEINSNPLKTS